MHTCSRRATSAGIVSFTICTVMPIIDIQVIIACFCSQSRRFISLKAYLDHNIKTIKKQPRLLGSNILLETCHSADKGKFCCDSFIVSRGQSQSCIPINSWTIL